MPTTIETTRNDLSEQDKKVVEFVLAFKRLPKRKKDRVGQLIDLLEQSDDCNEQVEIAIAIAEIVDPKKIGLHSPPGSTADPEDGVSEATKKTADAYKRHVGDEIRKCREALGLTQEQLAEKTGLPQSHICRLEVGKHAPTRSTIQRIAQALNTEPSKLDILYD